MADSSFWPGQAGVPLAVGAPLSTAPMRSRTRMLNGFTIHEPFGLRSRLPSFAWWTEGANITVFHDADSDLRGSVVVARAVNFGLLARVRVDAYVVGSSTGGSLVNPQSLKLGSGSTMLDSKMSARAGAATTADVLLWSSIVDTASQQDLTPDSEVLERISLPVGKGIKFVADGSVGLLVLAYVLTEVEV